MSLPKQQGVSLIEVVVGMAIVLVTVTAISLSFQAILRSAALANHVVQVGFLLEEGVEAAKVLRAGGWENVSALPTSTPRALVFSNGVWTTQVSRVFVDNLFDRTITVSPVYRDGNDDIAESGTIDYNTKKVSISVAWRERSATTTRTIDTYVTNFAQ